MNTSSAFPIQSIPTPENNLIDACRKGDQRAQLHLYKLYYKLIFNICLKVVPDQMKAEEIMHEVILALLEEIRDSPVSPGFSELIWKMIDRTLAAELGRPCSVESKIRSN